MTEITLVRHAQASFGAADYDVLSNLGHQQARALGTSLAAQGLKPVVAAIGEQRRHRETMEGIEQGLGKALPEPKILPGLNEFDSKGLVDAYLSTLAQDEDLSDRKTHFRTLRAAVLAWQRGEVDDPPETWQAFARRVRLARDVLAGAVGPVLAISSGGPISTMMAQTLDAAAEVQIQLQLQLKNCSVTRLIATRNGVYLHGFNETPHITKHNAAQMLTYS